MQLFNERKYEKLPYDLFLWLCPRGNPRAYATHALRMLQLLIRKVLTVVLSRDTLTLGRHFILTASVVIRNLKKLIKVYI